MKFILLLLMLVYNILSCYALELVAYSILVVCITGTRVTLLTECCNLLIVDCR